MRWVVGDIHGMFRPLDALLAEVCRRDATPHFIFVGDYVNRGPDSPKVIDRLLALSNATFLRGNHDDVFDLILHGTCYMCNDGAPEAMSAFAWFMQFGLADTLMAYGADAAELMHLEAHPDPKKLAELLKMVPEPHRQFIKKLRPVLEQPDIFVAHAYWQPDEPDGNPDIAPQLVVSSPLRQQIMWGRYTADQIKWKKRWKRTGYFGHTPVLNYSPAQDIVPLRGPQIVLVDTAAALVPHGRLSAVCVETGEVVQADRAGKIVV